MGDSIADLIKDIEAPQLETTTPPQVVKKVLNPSKKKTNGQASILELREDQN